MSALKETPAATDTTARIMDWIGNAAKEAAARLAQADGETKNRALRAAAQAVRDSSAAILDANERDMQAAEAKGLMRAMLDRLLLTPERIEGIAKGLEAVVEDCVNAVGVDVNTASAPLLARISGLNSTLAANIVEFRDSHGPFKSREALKAVPRLGPKTFEQAAGFLRIPAGVTHDFRNRTAERVGVLNVFIPGGFERDMPAITDWFRDNP